MFELQGKIAKRTLLWFALALMTLTSCLQNKSHLYDARPVDQVYPLLDAANSRWFYFASASRPFGMVNLSPDTELDGAWGSGYRYYTDTVKGFSHIHGWQIAGVSVMPVVFDEDPTELFVDYYSHFDHKDEVVEVGYHKVKLDRYDITTELTSTKRVGFHRYHFPKGKQPGIMFQLEGQLGPSFIKEGSLRRIDNYTIVGEIVNAPTKRRPKDFKVYFIVRFDQPFIGLVRGESHDMVVFARNTDDLQMKVGISYTSLNNADFNMTWELPHWDFDQVVRYSKNEWNKLLSRIQVRDSDSVQVRRFYTDLWHSLQGRRIINDVSGTYPDNTGDEFRVGQLPLDESGKPKFNHYNSDAFWGTQWTLNTLWGLVYPEIYGEFVNSLLVYYKDGGVLPRGPSGGNYTNVMTGASSTPFIVSAYQKGIKPFDPHLAYEAMKANHMPGGMMGRSGYEHLSARGGGIDEYMALGYVPYPNPHGDHGHHQDGASLTLEYAYQDWTLAQMAKALGNSPDYQHFMARSRNYKNVFDPSRDWMRPRNMAGLWKEPYDPYEYENGFNESNGVQASWFVPHDIVGLARLMGGSEATVEKLDRQFRKASIRGFTAGTSHERGENPNLARIAINYGNQPSTHTAFIFNHLGRPDLTKKWSKEVAMRAFGGLSPDHGYNGDEDQGQMGALAVLMKLGIFQMNGGTEANPAYQLGNPMFDQVKLLLENGRSFELIKLGKGDCISNIVFDGTEVEEMRHEDLTKGGKLLFKMSEAPL